MLTADEARGLASVVENPEVAERLAEFERVIRRSAEGGERSAKLCCLSDANIRAAMCALKARGFRIEKRSVKDRCDRYTAYFAEW